MGGKESDLENWLTAKKKYPGYLPDFYHIFCNTYKTLILNAKKQQQFHMPVNLRDFRETAAGPQDCFGVLALTRLRTFSI